MSCLHDHNKLQINTINENALRDQLTKQNILEPDAGKILALFNENIMSQAEIKEYLQKTSPYMTTIIDAWESSSLKNFMLTSVGIAIGHANVKKNLGEFTDLSIWIN